MINGEVSVILLAARTWKKLGKT